MQAAVERSRHGVMGKLAGKMAARRIKTQQQAQGQQ